MWTKGLLLKTTEGSAVVEACYENETQKITILAENGLLTQKIKEELANIANEGKLKSKEGKTESLSEKFGLAGLKPIFEGKDETMHSTIQKALKHLQNANYAGYFEEMDKVVPESMQNNYDKLRKNFMDKGSNWELTEQLETFAREVDKALNSK